MDFEIKEQVRLPMSKCVELVLSGVQFRIFRASITVAIIALAVAFLMTILGDSLVERQVRKALTKLSAPRQTFMFWNQRLSQPMTQADLASAVMGAEKRDPRWEELKHWGECQDEALMKLKRVSAHEAEWLRFFANLKEGEKRQLVGRAMGREILALLQDETAFQNFSSEIKTLGVEVPKSMDELRTFLGEWQAQSGLREKIIDGHADALKAIQKLFGGRSAAERLSVLDDAMMAGINGLGFRVLPQDVPALRAESARSLDAKRIEDLLEKPSFKQQFAIQYGVKDMNKVSAMMLYGKFTGRSDVKWLFKQKDAANLKMSPERVREVSRELIGQKRFDRIETALSDIGQGTGMFGFSTRVQWLIIVSLIVCTVGIANAMLMSVTERFREIATMKCLGATDGFIMINFLLESGLQGLAGGIIGGLLGAILGIVRASVACGTMAIQNIPGIEMVISFLICIVVGILLSIVAAIYPAKVAARLAPMEAMRVE
ncbi:MAG: hypothetical protein C0404_05765 [Verrucomicrobia bacterium]|nr:hypothetical protein [Verrucomicrobiota bacterium]